MAAQFRRLRKGAANTAVAAVVVAALAASQGPGAMTEGAGGQPTTGTQPSSDAATQESATGNSPYYTDLPPLDSPSPAPTVGPTVDPAGTGDAAAGIPATVLDAYQRAAAELRSAKPGCNLPWELLAAIGKVESGQARGGDVKADGTTLTPILGPQLNGNGFADISDTDNGRFDGDTRYDRAVGPMQFIPSTWAWAGRDGNGDGLKDPNNVYDAALAAGHYLCRFGWDLSTQPDLDRAILSYNQSQEYLATVLSWMEYYRKGTHEIPDGTGELPDNRSDEPRGPSPSPTPPRTPETGTPERPTTPPTTPPGDSGSPSPKPPSSPSPSPSPQTPTDTVDHLANAGAGRFTAMAGDTFSGRIGARAETEAGQGVGKVRIRFTVVGDTDTTFTGGESVATVATDSTGVAVAPALRAGEKAGVLEIRAAVVGRTLPGVTYRATVTPRAADALAPVGGAALTCVAGGEFAGQVQMKAMYGGAVADGVAATATLVTSAADPTVNDRGPYFKNADGTAVRTLSGLRTDADGLLTLPKLYADDATGTFVLRVTTTGGAVLMLTLTVTEPVPAAPTAGTSAEPSAPTSASPTATASAADSASPTG